MDAKSIMTLTGPEDRRPPVVVIGAEPFWNQPKESVSLAPVTLRLREIRRVLE